MRSVLGLRCILTAALALGAGLGACSTALAADGGVWSVSKSTGDVWVTTTGAQKASLTQEGNLKPGDTIRTGPNGRVLLVRGEESMLIAPNSVISVPVEAKDGMQTTILQRAGSIVLEVEKKNVQHFEVETPYLAAVVKGTQFIVTVNADSTSVAVRRGQVEVSDFKTGQIAQVLPGQIATSFERGKSGLTLSGSGTFNPIEQGKPRASSIDRVPVPRNGLSAPRNAASGTVIHALAHIGQSSARTAAAPSSQGVKPNVIRISSALGEVKLNVQKATHGLARGATVPGSARVAANKDNTVWSNGGMAASNPASVASNGNSNSGSNGVGSSASGGSSTAGVTSTVGSVVAVTGSKVDGVVNDATGNGKGLGLGLLGLGNNGNGNGNGGVGNGNGKGNLKH
jgi:FecR-like protein